MKKINKIKSICFGLSAAVLVINILLFIAKLWYADLFSAETYAKITLTSFGLFLVFCIIGGFSSFLSEEKEVKGKNPVR